MVKGTVVFVHWTWAWSVTIVFLDPYIFLPPLWKGNYVLHNLASISRHDGIPVQRLYGFLYFAWQTRIIKNPCWLGYKDENSPTPQMYKIPHSTRVFCISYTILDLRRSLLPVMAWAEQHHAHAVCLFFLGLGKLASELRTTVGKQIIIFASFASLRFFQAWENPRYDSSVGKH